MVTCKGFKAKTARSYRNFGITLSWSAIMFSGIVLQANKLMKALVKLEMSSMIYDPVTTKHRSQVYHDFRLTE